MHESRTIANLISQAETEAERAGGGVISRLVFRIGAMAPVTAEGIRHGVTELAQSRWGTSPVVDVHHGDDPTDPTALGVVLVSIGLED